MRAVGSASSYPAPGPSASPPAGRPERRGLAWPERTVHACSGRRVGLSRAEAQLLIFLDFDGVLRCQGKALFVLEAHLVARFERTLRELPGVEVVISSSWRGAFPLDEIVALFSPDIRPRIIGATPTLLERLPFRRDREVLAYLADSGQAGRAWVAIDDQREHYRERPNLLIVDERTGFDEDAATWLVAMARRYGVVGER